MKRIITVCLSIALLAFLLLACGAAGTPGVIDQADMARACAEDPTCHPAPQWVQNQIQDGK